MALYWILWKFYCSRLFLTFLPFDAHQQKHIFVILFLSWHKWRLNRCYVAILTYKINQNMCWILWENTQKFTLLWFLLSIEIETKQRKCHKQRTTKTIDMMHKHIIFFPLSRPHLELRIDFYWKNLISQCCERAWISFPFHTHMFSLTFMRNRMCSLDDNKKKSGKIVMLC